MWIFTPDGGFLSAVQDKLDPDVIVVRARAHGDLKDLARLIPDLMIIRGGGTDYPVRARVTREAWVLACARMAGEVGYGNYKDMVTARKGKRRHDIYLSVWATLRRLERGPRRRKRSAGERLFADDWLAPLEHDPMQ